MAHIIGIGEQAAAGVRDGSTRWPTGTSPVLGSPLIADVPSTPSTPLEDAVRSRAVALIASAIGLLGPLALTAPAQADSDVAYVEGYVTDDAGHALTAVDVTVAWCRTPKGKDLNSLGCAGKVTLGDAPTDASGAYTVPVEKGFARKVTGRGHYIAVVRKPYVPQHVHATIKAPRVGHDVTAPVLRVTPSAPAPVDQSAFIPGTLTSTSGAPVASGQVTLYYGDLASSSVYADHFGRFSFPRANIDATYAGPLRFQAYAFGFETAYSQSFTYAEAGNATQNIVLTPLGTVHGKVKVPHRGRGWRAHVNVRDADGHKVAKAVTDSRGHFRVGHLATGAYTLKVKARRYHPSTAMHATLSDVAVTAGRATGVGHVTVHPH